MPKEVSAGAVVYREKEGRRQYLLLHYRTKRALWGFPKGKIEEGEQPVDAARREIREETGLQVDIKEGFMETLHYYFKQDDQTISKDVHYFVAEAKSDAVRLSDEHSGYIWVGKEGALKRLSFSNAKDVLKKAEAFLG